MTGLLRLIGICLIQFPRVAGAGAPDLEVLIDSALARNSGLKVLEHRLAAFEARVPLAGALEDPMLGLDLRNLPTNSFDFNSTHMSGKQLTVSQRIPLPGLLRAKEQAAEFAAGAAREVLADRTGTIVNLVKQGYYSLAFLDRAIEVTERNRALLRDLVRIAEKKYVVGRGLQQDVLKAQVSLSELRDRLIGLNTDRRLAEARLNRVLNRPMETAVSATGEVTATPFDLSAEDVRRMALAHRPLLKEIGHTVSRWVAAEQAARRSGRPELTFRLGYVQRAHVAPDPVRGSDFLSFGVSMNLPIFNGRKRDNQIAEARANIRMVEAQKEDVSREIQFRVQEVCLEVDRHWNEAELFRSAILPQAQQSLESAMAGYQVDKVDFLTLLNNQVSLLQFEIEYYRHVIEREKELAKLEAIVGKRLF
ncbi:MAG: TolC family protein [Gemmatimonadota bacterium]|nr:TolC family protein [Gemmatimonadota bacterium]